MFDPENIDCSPQVEYAAKAFIAAWLINHDKRIEGFLDDIPEEMLVEAHDVLIRLELYLRASDGESMDESEYLTRFPEFKEEVWGAFHQNELTSSRSQSAHLPTDSHGTRSESLISEDSDFILSKTKTDIVPETIGRYVVEKELGRGGFGVVCLATDTQLERKVALKFARTSRFNSVEEMDKLIDEARTAAKLDCPGIVSVFDVIVDDQFICIVQQLVDGNDLSEEIESGTPTFEQSASWMATTCMAIAVAHSKGFIHRDLKPANILIDSNNEPLITDFGLAIHESYQRRRRGDRSGTPGYMSPELVRGESHRIDGRSDIWSLGVIFYLLLTGRKPFSGESAVEIFDEIKHREPRPPREIRPEIPAELERICLKCLNKPVGQRYSTARDMAKDLRRWLQDSAQHSHSLSDSMSDRISEVVPKGLRSFDEEDSEFFLMLIPGPVGRSGLPESIQSWKRRLGRDVDNPIPIGLLYGPSGCGKSSYVKAGLLPYLPSYIKKFRIEATPADTEVRLIQSLRSRYSDIPSDISLLELFRSLREGVWTDPSDRVLIVIDQFEQWLHGRNRFEGTELVEALRQCDGKRVQCLLMVRDDFWLATSRFLKALEIVLVEGKNAALIDLFDIPHAERVLKHYGRGYGRIGDKITKVQEDFVKLAVEQLSEDGKVICVRLSLFAEMFKDKPWKSANLKRAGGISGVGVAFLEETFSARNAPAKNRLHEAAARNVLNALLPNSSVDIRGNMRSKQDLLHLSGYSNRPNAFLELMTLLDKDLRLITPTDPSGMGDANLQDVGVAHDFYQLTHDYLVAPLRIWLHQKNRETASGRAQLKLDERHATWARTKESRFLPAVFEYLNIRFLTRRKNWSNGEREMMKRADRYYGFRFAVLAGSLVLAGVAGNFWYRNVQANSLAKRLLDAKFSEVPSIVQEIRQRNLSERIAPIVASTNLGADRRQKLNVEVAFSELPGNREAIWRRLNEELDADESVIAANAFQPSIAEIHEAWQILTSPTAGSSNLQRLRMATALSNWDSENENWNTASRSVVQALLEQNPLFIEGWFEAMPSIRIKLLKELVEHGASWQIGTDTKKMASALGLIKEHYQSWPDIHSHLTTEFRNSDFVTQIGVQPEKNIDAFERLTQRQANLATILLLIGEPEVVLDQINGPHSERQRQLLTAQLRLFVQTPDLIGQNFSGESRPIVRATLWQILGSYPPDALPESLLAIAKDDFKNNPNSLVHSAAEWFLSRAGQDDWIKPQEEILSSTLADSRRAPTKEWRINSQRQTMIRIETPGVFPMTNKRSANIPYQFEVSSKEISIEQFLRSNSSTYAESIVELLMEDATTANEKTYRRPITSIRWFQAAEYCNWLSKQDGIPEDQWCYEADPNPIKGFEYYEQPSFDEAGKPVLRLVKDFRKRTGYRLPLESEWEWLANPNWNKQYHTPTHRLLLSEQEWFKADGLTRPVGLKSPSRFGLFDIYGNVKEYCSDSRTTFSVSSSWVVVDEGSTYQDPIEISENHPEVWQSNYGKLSRGVALFYENLDEDRHLASTKGEDRHLGFRVLRRVDQSN